jgi:hypothetical protein
MGMAMVQALKQLLHKTFYLQRLIKTFILDHLLKTEPDKYSKNVRNGLFHPIQKKYSNHINNLKKKR